jgi:hypothetical protein
MLNASTGEGDSFPLYLPNFRLSLFSPSETLISRGDYLVSSYRMMRSWRKRYSLSWFMFTSLSIFARQSFIIILFIGKRAFFLSNWFSIVWPERFSIWLSTERLLWSIILDILLEWHLCQFQHLLIRYLNYFLFFLFIYLKYQFNV